MSNADHPGNFERRPAAVSGHEFGIGADAMVRRSMVATIDVDPLYDGTSDTEPNEVRILMTMSQVVKLRQIVEHHRVNQLPAHDVVTGAFVSEFLNACAIAGVR